MTHSPDLLDPYRARVLADVHALLDTVGLTHLQPVREHLESLEGTNTRVFDAAIVHLVAVEAFAGDVEKGLPVASALALLALSTDVMQALRASAVQPAGVVESAWGMPRTLNAGDASYALGQQSLMRLVDHGFPSEDVMKASSILRTDTLGLCEDLLAPSATGTRRDVAAALALAAVLAGADDVQIDALMTADGQLDDEILGLLSTDDAARRRLQAALAELIRERWV